MNTPFTPFTPADGHTPRWRKLYDLITTRQPGDEITYREARDLLDCDLHTAQSAMRDAIRRLERDGQLTVKTVERFGWVVLNPAGELDQVDRRLTKTRRAAGRAARGAGAVEGRRDQLSQFERERLDRMKRAALAVGELTSRRRSSLAELRKMIETEAS